MSVGQILDEVRGYYLKRLMDQVLEFGKTDRFLREAAYCKADGEFATEGALDLPLRMDFYLYENESHPAKVLAVSSQNMLSFEPVQFNWGSMLIKLHPFRWEELLVMAELPSAPDWRALKEWFWKWFQDDDSGDEDFLQAVHFLSDPNPRDGGFEFQMDLGTAPVEAFEDLLDALAECGATRVDIGYL